MPDAALSTDIIVGFPTETPDEFQDTVDVVKQVEFDSAFIFKYSERPNTLAAHRLPDDVSEEEKTRRIVELNEIQRAISLKKNQAQIGSETEILIEEESTKKSDSDYQGRTDTNRIVILPKGPYQRGDYVRVRITDATTNVLKGIPVA